MAPLAGQRRPIARTANAASTNAPMSTKATTRPDMTGW